MRYLVKSKKSVKECDGVAAAPIDTQMSIGMGPVDVVGGPDRWDNILAPLPRKRHYRVKKRRK